MTNPIAPITSQQVTRHALIGALADDPVLPEPPRRPRRRTTRSDRRSG
jgi:hypothetical protein